MTTTVLAMMTTTTTTKRKRKRRKESRDQTSRMSFSHDARLINKDLGRIIAETTPSPQKKQTLSATSKLNLDHPNRPPPISGSLYTFSNSRELRVNICEASKCFDDPV